MSNVNRTDEKFYADRDVIKQGQVYMNHVLHMTSEALHSKSDIAAELAHRDIEISHLNAQVAELELLINNPHTDDFIKAVQLEAAHQIQRCGAQGDAEKAEAGKADLELRVAVAVKIIDESAKLADWINEARPIITELMLAYERRIRSDCNSQHDLDKKPWECTEYMAAKRLLDSQPVAVVDITMPMPALHEFLEQHPEYKPDGGEQL